MRPTVTQLLAWDPAALEAVADDLARHRSALVGLEEEFAGSRPPPREWQAPSAEEARARLEELRQRLGDLVAEVSTVTGALDVAARPLAEARAQLQAALERAASAGLVVGPGGQVSAAPSGAYGGAYGAASDEEARETAHRVREALERAAGVDAELALALETARHDAVRGGTGSLADAALPSYLRGLGDRGLLEWALAHPGQAAPFLGALPAEVRRALGAALAGRLGPDDPGSGARLLELLGDDQVVATATLEALGPERLLQLTGALFLAGASGRTLQDRLGRLLATAACDDGRPGGRLSDRFLDGLAQAAVRTSGRRPGWQVDGPEALAPLLRQAAGSRRLLVRLGSAVLAEDVERASRAGRFGVSWDGPPSPGTDPVTALLEALAENPQAARDLLGSDDHLRHLLTGRDWPTDPDHPGVAALGRALEAATTHDPDDRSARVVEGMIAAFHERFADAPDDATLGEVDLVDPRLRGQVAAVLGEYLPSLHHALDGPPPDTFGDSGARGQVVVPPAGDTTAGQVVTAVLSDVGKDPEAAALLVEQSNGHAAELLVRRLHPVADLEALGRELPVALDALVGPHLEVVAALDHGRATGLRAEQLADDVGSTARRHLAVDVGSTVVKLVVEAATGPASGPVGSGIDIATRHVKAELAADTTGATNRQHGLLFGASSEGQERLVRTVVEQLLPPGLTDEERATELAAVEQRVEAAYGTRRGAAEELVSAHE